MMFDNLGNTLQYIQDGKLDAVAVGSAQRLKALPDVPTLGEMFPGAGVGNVVRRGRAAEYAAGVSGKISSAISETIRQPDVAKRSEAMSAIPVWRIAAGNWRFHQKRKRALAEGDRGSGRESGVAAIKLVTQ